jgi:hypothetical protein
MIYNIIPIDFQNLFLDRIQKDILDSLFTYKLLQNNTINIRNKETNRLISYFIIYHVIKTITEGKIDKSIIILQPNIFNCDDILYGYISEPKDLETFYNLIRKILKILSKTYPSNVILLKKFMDINSKDTMEYLFNKCNQFVGGSDRVLSTFSNKNFNNPGLVTVYKKEEISL